MGEALDLRGVDVVRDIDGLVLLGKYHGNVEFLRDDTRDSDAAGFDGDDLGDLFALIQALELLRKLRDKIDVDLVIDKAVDL